MFLSRFLEQSRNIHWPLFQRFNDRVARRNKGRSCAGLRPNELIVAPDGLDSTRVSESHPDRSNRVVTPSRHLGKLFHCFGAIGERGIHLVARLVLLQLTQVRHVVRISFKILALAFEPLDLFRQVVADLLLQMIKQFVENSGRKIAERRAEAVDKIAGLLAVVRFVPFFD